MFPGDCNNLKVTCSRTQFCQT